MDQQQRIRRFCDEGGSTSSSSETVAGVRRSFADAALCTDIRVLRTMLRAEDGQLSTTTGHVVYSQGDLQPSMRRTVVSWMLEVRYLNIFYHCRACAIAKLFHPNPKG